MQKSSWLVKGTFAVSVALAAMAILRPNHPAAMGQVATDTKSSAGLIGRIEELERRLSQLSSDFTVGTVIFCANNQAPGKNWVPCDGKSRFPEDAPPDLKGKSVPNLQGGLVGVGNWEQKPVAGTLKVQQIDGGKLLLPEPTVKRIAADQGNATKPTFKGGLVTIFKTNANDPDVKHNTAHWNCFGGEMNVVPALYEYHPKGTSIVSSVEIAPPPHAFLQAYVKIR